MDEKDAVEEVGWFERVLRTEPAVWKAIITGLVALGLTWGIDFTGFGEQLKESADILAALVVVLGGFWTRASVVPESRVIERLDESGLPVAGRAIRPRDY